MNTQNIIYTGAKLAQPVKLPTCKTIAPYIPDKELIEVVRLARLLKRPLLIQGEPGSGKTRLAQAVAYELYQGDYKDHYFEWNIKSTSKAKDGLYTFDHLKRLRDAQVKDGDKKLSPANYIQKGAIALAFEKSTKEQPSILLIDEIDKADIDFPNDLLLELDQLRYEIEEISGEFEENDKGEKIYRSQKAEYPPIVFITSNEERELPPAFLRRCLYHYISFPTKELLSDIVNRNFPHIHDTILQKSLDHFLKLRQDMEKDKNSMKLPSTSEFLDFVKVIAAEYEQNLIALLQKKTNITEDKKTSLIQSIEQIDELEEDKVKELANEIKAILQNESLEDMSINQKLNNDLKGLHYPTLIKTLNDYKKFIKKI